MKFVEPAVYLIAKSQLDSTEVRRWLDDLEVKNFEAPQQATEAEKLTLLAGKRCYMSFEAGLNPNVSRVRKDIVAFIDNILSSRHGSVLEHSSYSFAIENVSRVFTGEMNRHRAGWAVSEGSMRYIRFADIPFWMPHSIREDTGDSPEIAEAKRRTREIFERAFQQMEDHYRELENIWRVDSLKAFNTKKKITSLMRRIIGMGVATGGIWTGNLRAIRHVLAVRVDVAAEEEIAYVFGLVLKRLVEAEPTIFADFEQNEEGFWKPKYWKV
ncbi:thymidylate synthase (FAD) [candidate division KSB3 bacterium]|uniref:FAD-dependent thymidylate synthase n=1 Tax=candidate division KSB3 bacterium TaxID=2044937 RepID=A0A2G6E501_9BACT|nr:MAG: thymidylate synthase (FAD) [candidate division KSB3 bacterium]PIE28366.1 MAG: thymidylate synthase (FAD) [candidate division KSB3 bacterium]